MTAPPASFDVLVIGSGFGGSVTAMRLAQKGYRVAVLESGKRYRAQDFPKTNWDVRKYFWAPKFGCFGIHLDAVHVRRDRLPAAQDRAGYRCCHIRRESLYVLFVR